MSNVTHVKLRFTFHYQSVLIKPYSPDVVEFHVAENQLEGKVPEELCTIVGGLSVDNVGCDLICDCCIDEEGICGTSKK